MIRSYSHFIRNINKTCHFPKITSFTERYRRGERKIMNKKSLKNLTTSFTHPVQLKKHYWENSQKNMAFLLEGKDQSVLSIILHGHFSKNNPDRTRSIATNWKCKWYIQTIFFLMPPTLFINNERNAQMWGVQVYFCTIAHDTSFLSSHTWDAANK